MKFSEYSKSMSEVGREDREKLLTKARYDNAIPVAEYIKLEQLDQALTDIEDRRGNKK